MRTQATRAADQLPASTTNSSPLALIPQEKLAEELGVTTWTLTNWRKIGKGPVYVRLDKRILYDRADVDTWLASRKVTPALATAAGVV